MRQASKLNMPGIRLQFQLELRNRFSYLSVEEKDNENRLEDEGEGAHENEVEKKWKKIKETYCKAAKDVLDFRKRKKQ